MGQIGCLGDVAFRVSSEAIETINNMVISMSANYATHERHRTYALTEFTGVDASKISFDMELSRYLGIRPLAEIKKLRKYLREGTALPLVLGDHVYGKYCWTIQALKVNAQGHDRNGNLERATVSVTLLEYLRS